MKTEEKTVHEVTLSDGRIAVIHRGKGRHAKAALRAAGSDQGAYMNSLMSQLIEFRDSLGNTTQLVPEDWDELDIEDYMLLQGEFAAVNFTRVSTEAISNTQI